MRGLKLSISTPEEKREGGQERERELVITNLSVGVCLVS